MSGAVSLPGQGLATGASTAPSPLYRPPERLSRPLRVVVMTTDGVPAWIDAFARLAADIPWLDVRVLSVRGDSGPVGHGPGTDALRLAVAIERRRSRSRWRFLQPASQVLAAPSSGPTGGRDETLAALDASQPDLVLAALDVDWIEAVAATAAWGCWQLDASLRHELAALSALVPPLLRRGASTPMSLQLRSVDGEWLQVAGGRMATCRASLGGQLQRACGKLPSLLVRALLAQSRAPGRGERRVSRLRLAPLSPAVGLSVVGRAFAAAIGERLHERWRRARSREGRWSVMVRQQARSLDPAHPEVSGCVELAAPDGWYWADPCVIGGPDGELVYVEECPDDVNAGLIACLRVDASGACERVGVALQRPFHLSFPQLFDWRGQRFMTVESGQDRRVTLYRRGASALDWQPVSELLQGWPVVDPVLHFHDGRWYLFANVAEGGASSCDSLFLFVAEELTGPYRPHPANPIVDDAGCARMAGRLFVDRGRLVRPSQDCVGAYGAAVVFNEVLELGPERYRERILGRLDAATAGARDGCHTYSRSGRLETIDVRGFGCGGARRPQPAAGAGGLGASAGVAAGG